MRVYNDENAVCISGTLSTDPVLDHQLYGEDFYTASIMIPRLSGTIDCIPVTLPNRALGFMPTAGERVRIYGQLRSYNRHNADGSHLCLTVFAKDMEAIQNEDMPENKISITGYLCKPAIYRTTPFKREIGDMLIACNRSFNKSDYLPCIAWGRNAQLVSELPVGGRLYVKGRIQSRRYQKLMPDGTVQDRTAHEISCTEIELI